jgi:hypothetical protein
VHQTEEDIRWLQALITYFAADEVAVTGHAIVKPIATPPGFSRRSNGAPGAIQALKPRRACSIVVAAGSMKTGS